MFVIVRCGRCGTRFDVPGPGRHGCPACGTPNDVRAAAPAAPSRPAPPPVPEAPSPRVTCPDCGHAFIVGAIAVAPCPNCGNPVTVAPIDSEDA